MIKKSKGRKINTTTETESNEWVIRGSLVNFVGREAVSGHRWFEYVFIGQQAWQEIIGTLEPTFYSLSHSIRSFFSPLLVFLHISCLIYLHTDSSALSSRMRLWLNLLQQLLRFIEIIVYGFSLWVSERLEVRTSLQTVITCFRKWGVSLIVSIFLFFFRYQSLDCWILWPKPGLVTNSWVF